MTEYPSDMSQVDPSIKNVVFIMLYVWLGSMCVRKTPEEQTSWLFLMPIEARRRPETRRMDIDTYTLESIHPMTVHQPCKGLGIKESQHFC